MVSKVGLEEHDHVVFILIVTNTHFWTTYCGMKNQEIHSPV